MKFALSLLTLLTSASALAAVLDLDPSKQEFSPSVVERVITMQKETVEQPAVRLVQIDNGGSSDISSYASPSSLYLTFHQDGEMFDIDGAYKLTNSASKVEVEEFDAKRGFAKIKYKSMTEDLKAVEVKALILLGSALKEIRTAQSDAMDNFEMKAGITVETQTK